MPAIPYTTPALALAPDVAIVGPSRRLLGTNLGTTIDRHEEVVRFNRAPTRGYTADVGMRTTLRAMNSQAVGNGPLGAEFPNADYDFVPNLRDARVAIHGWARPPADAVGQPDALGPGCARHYLIHADFEPVMGIPGCTMGAAMVWLCVQAGVRPVVYGFDVDEGTPRSHYWELRPPVSTHAGHAEELALLRALRDAGRAVFRS